MKEITEKTQDNIESIDTTNPKKKVHKLSLENIENFNKKLQRRGVIYLSRIPPRMGPSLLKIILSEHGKITRIYLVEEDKVARKRRLQASAKKSKRGKRYVEGWVEFEDKNIAKQVAAALHMTPISITKGNTHYGDLWNMKYLKKFRWDILTEKVAYERRVREEQMKIDMMCVRKEHASYVEKVIIGNKMDMIEDRLHKKGKKMDYGNMKRKFRQITPLSSFDVGKETTIQKDLLKSLL